MNAKSIFLFLVPLVFTQIPSKAAVDDSSASKLNSPVSAVRLEAIRQIALNYSSENFSLLVNAALDEDDDVRERAVQALGFSGSLQAVETLKEALKDRDEFVRWRAVQALWRLEALNTADEAAPLIEDPCWRVRVSVCELLGDVSIKHFQNNSGKQALKVIREVLRKAMKDNDERVKLAAASALARNKDNSALEPLLDLLQNGSMMGRAAAGVALGDLGDPVAIKPLVEAISDPRNREESDGSDFARWGPVKGLVKIAGRDMGSDIAIDAAAKERKGFERNRAITSLRHLKLMDIAGDTAGLLKSKDRQVKLTVIELKGTIDDRILESYVRQFLEDDDPSVRKAARDALAR